MTKTKGLWDRDGTWSATALGRRVWVGVTCVSTHRELLSAGAACPKYVRMAAKGQSFPASDFSGSYLITKGFPWSTAGSSMFRTYGKDSLVTILMKIPASDGANEPCPFPLLRRVPGAHCIYPLCLTHQGAPLCQPQGESKFPIPSARGTLSIMFVSSCLHFPLVSGWRCG